MQDPIPRKSTASLSSPSSAPPAEAANGKGEKPKPATLKKRRDERPKEAPPLALVVLYSGPWPERWAPSPDFPLQEGVYPLGRENPDGDGLEFSKDLSCSRLHAELEVSAEGRLSIKDCNSTNGTFVNRRAISEPTEVTRGDLIRVGDTLLLVTERSAGNDSSTDAIPTLRGTSPQMRALREKILKVANDPAPVLILGETGTGKELVAQALHQCSERAGRFTAFNCGAIPAQLAQSQLFGHKKGAFTGALTDEQGLFRSAEEGTLFLDEIAELPYDLQPMLFRALEEREVTPVGHVKSTAYTARVVCATNQDLHALENASRFRQELRARLERGVVLRTPPLRERREDILQLLDHEIVKKLDERKGCGLAVPVRGELSISPELAELLLTHGWPLNVREIAKVANHLVLFGETEELINALRSAEQVCPSQPRLPSVPLPKPPVPPPVPQPSRDVLAREMRESRGNIRQVAKKFGCDRRTIGRWLEKLELDRDYFRKSEGGLEQGASYAEPLDTDADSASNR